MITRWGRKGLVAGAYAVTFVTAVAVTPTTTVKKVQYRPDVRQEVRYVTPTGVAPPATYIKEYKHRPSISQHVRFVTPVDVVITPTPAYQNVGNDGVSDEELRLANIKRDDKEIIDLIKVVMQSGILDA